MKVQQLIGNAGDKPKDGDTKVGTVTRVSVAVTRAYPSTPGADDGETRWVQVANFKPSIQKQMHDKIDKGTVVIAEGVITEGSYDGKPQYSMKASRVGIGEFFLPSAEDKAKGAARAKAAKLETDDEEGW